MDITMIPPCPCNNCGKLLKATGYGMYMVRYETCECHIAAVKRGREAWERMDVDRPKVVGEPYHPKCSCCGKALPLHYWGGVGSCHSCEEAWEARHPEDYAIWKSSPHC